MNIFLTGATGTIGRTLCPALIAAGHQVMALARSEGSARLVRSMGAQPVAGDMTEGGPWLTVMNQCDAVVHLAGVGIFARWSSAYKEKIRASRVVSTRLIAGAVSANDSKVRVLLSGSAAGYYGSDVPDPRDEFSPPGTDFLASVCVSWERAACIDRPAVRTVFLRSGVVLAREGGALKTMLPAFRMGLGGRLGSGRQMMSWIHIQDWVRAALFLLGRDDLKGPFNLTAPYAVSNREFVKTLATVLGRPSVLPVPSAVMKLVLGEVATAVLGHQHVRPVRLLESGFVFSYPDIRSALTQLLT